MSDEMKTLDEIMAQAARDPASFVAELKAQEGAFRRGYLHGANAILDMLERGYSLAQLTEYINAKLSPWRDGLSDDVLPPGVEGRPEVPRSAQLPGRS